MLNKSLGEKVIVRLQQLGNSAEDTLLGLRQIALNAPWIVFGPSLQSLAGAFRGRLFIWVAAGPSLDKNVHLLSWHESKVPQITGELPRGGFSFLGAAIKEQVNIHVAMGNRINHPVRPPARARPSLRDQE